MYSRTIIIGNLARDIEKINTSSGAVLGKGSIAYSDGYGDKKKTHFIDFVAFSKTAEALNNYTRKGSKVMLEGVIQFEQWTAQDGTNRNKHALRVDTMKMLDSKPKDQGQESNYNQANSNYNQPQPQYTAQSNYPEANTRQEHKIPEIDIEEEQIPF